LGDAVARVRDAGFTGVLANGGSGFGPDMLLPETLADTKVLPGLMPLTREASQAEMERRCGLLREAGLRPWLCMWGVPGVDVRDENGRERFGNNTFDLRTKLELRALYQAEPDLFGSRGPRLLSWRGNRPLCISHPKVETFYAELMVGLLARWPDLQGILYFPGDHGAEICDDTCPRCRAAGLDPWQRLVRHVNAIHAAARSKRPDFKLTYTFWNGNYTMELKPARGIMETLHPDVDVCMPMSDHVELTHRGFRHPYTQPWVTRPEVGEQFRAVCALARDQGRGMMALGELAQSEVWDPPCHNMPNPGKVLTFLSNAHACEGVDAVADFWGHRGPYLSHANLAAMAAWFAAPEAPRADQLRCAAMTHYGLSKAAPELVDQALSAWERFDAAVDEWAVAGWGQRFSPAIGRKGGWGAMYRPLIPPELRRLAQARLRAKGEGEAAGFVKRNECMQQDRETFLEAGRAFRALAEALDAVTSPGAELARREADSIALAGELIGSQGRMLAAAVAYAGRDASVLRALVVEEIEARHRQLALSAAIGEGGGVNVVMVEQDLQNMMLFLSMPGFPDVDEDVFAAAGSAL
jgi:hypothetical protein